jgi:hypothetical protein
MTYNEIIYTVRESIRRYTLDSTIDDREIIFQVNMQRALHLRNEYNKSARNAIETVKQTICLNLTQVEDCLLTTTTIPKFIELHEKPAISRITSKIQSDIPFDFVPFVKLPFVGNGRFNRKNVFISLTPDSKLLVKSGNPLIKMLDRILVTGIYENPLELKDFKCNFEQSVDCYSDDAEYPLTPHIFIYILPYVTDYFLRKLQVPRDTTNNANEQ